MGRFARIAALIAISITIGCVAMCLRLSIGSANIASGIADTRIRMLDGSYKTANIAVNIAIVCITMLYCPFVITAITNGIAAVCIGVWLGVSVVTANVARGVTCSIISVRLNFSNGSTDIAVWIAVVIVLVRNCFSNASAEITCRITNSIVYMSFFNESSIMPYCITQFYIFIQSRNGICIRLRTTIPHVFQIVTSGKCILSDGVDAVAQHQRCQLTAISICVIANGGYAIGNVHSG